MSSNLTLTAIIESIAYVGRGWFSWPILGNARGTIGHLMALLNLYRRHGSHCVGGRALHATTYEADELCLSWKRCLPIYASGTLAGRFTRKNTERTPWEEAKPLVRAWEDACSWDGPAKVTALPLWVASGLSAKTDERYASKPVRRSWMNWACGRMVPTTAES